MYFLISGILAISSQKLQSILSSQEYRSLDKGWSSFESFEHQFWGFGNGKRTVRITPLVNNIPVINADRILVLDEDEWNVWRIPNEHRGLVLDVVISPSEALYKLNEFIGHQRIIENRSIHDVVLHHSDEDFITPVYRFFDSLSNHVWIINGLDGSLVKSFSTINHENALVYPKGQPPSFGKRPPQTNILSNGSTVGVTSIRNADFISLNTCFAYQCRGRNDSNCLPTDAICVDPTPDMKEGVDYYTSTSYFTVPGQTFDFNRDWEGEGYQNGNVWLAWINSPVAASRLSFPEDRVWGSNLNWEQYTGLEQNDAINELQAFYHLSNHAAFLRNSLGIPNFCFSGVGDNCSEVINSTIISSISSATPIQFFTNLVTINITPDSMSKYSSFADQFEQGLGKTRDNPIAFDQYSDYNNAFYSRQPLRSIIPNCTNAGCVDINSFQFTAFGFGQSSTTQDWALNECVVYHELVHALVAQLIPDIGAYTWADTGLRSDPGAMNEAWADYFAAIHCGITDFTKTYNTHPKRNLENSRTCASAVGQVHSDGQIFSGAIWKVRSKILSLPAFSGAEDQRRFDTIILRAISLGHAKDLFADQFNTILSLLRSDEYFSSLVPFAEEEFKRREFDCVREYLFEEFSDPTFTLPENIITLTNLSTIPSQIRFQPRISDWGVFVTWRQFANDGRLGKLDIGFAQQPMKLLISPCPIYIQQAAPNSSAIEAFSNCSAHGDKTKLQFIPSSYSNLYGSVTFPIHSNGYSNSMFMIIASDLPTNMVLFSSSLTYYGFNYVWRVTFSVLGCISCIFMLMLLCLFARSCLTLEVLNRKAYLFLAVSFLMEVLSGLMAFFAILFGVVRSYFTVGTIGLTLISIPLLTFANMKIEIVDPLHLELPNWIDRYLKGDSSIKRWFVLCEFFRALTLLVSVAIIISYTAPVWIHSIFYGCFLLVSAGHYYLSFLLIYHSYYVGQLEHIIELDDV